MRFRRWRLALAMLVASTAPAAWFPASGQERTLAFPEPAGATGGAETTLETGFYNLPGLAAADVLPRGTTLGFVGQNASLSGGGTGTQNYFLGAEYGLTERLQLGVTWNKFADPVTFGGGANDIFWRSASVNGAYRFFDNGRLRITGRASAAWLSYRSDFHGSESGADATHLIGSLHLPMSVALGPAADLLLVPGVSVFPDEINGMAMYGTLPQLGIGATVRAGRRLGFYGLVNVPFGENGNTYDRVTGAPENVPVWTAGARFMATPNAALDLYVTNGFGASPAMDVLAFIPANEDMVIGVKLSYVPGWTGGGRPGYRGLRDGPPTARDRQLQFRGLTMASAETLEAGRGTVSVGVSGNGHYRAALRFSPDHDLEVGYAIEGLEDDGTRRSNRRLADPGDPEDRWAVQGKIRFFDQLNGSPFTLSGNVELGRSWSRFGVAYGSIPMLYRFSPSVAVMAEPKAAFYSDQELYGLALGANVALFEGFEVIGEVTPMLKGDRATWALGGRYHLEALTGLPLTVDLSASNAAGNHAAATMIGQDEIRYTLGVTVPLDGRGILDSLF